MLYNKINFKLVECMSVLEYEIAKILCEKKKFLSFYT